MEKWFDPTVYMQNKLAQMQATDPAYAMSDLVAAFAKAGFVGPEGYFQHFQQFGAAEEVAPNAYFNANEYYAAKAAQFYGDKFDGSELQIAQVKTLINKEGMNAWTHYQQFGSAEGVNPSNAFDASDYCAAKAAAMIKAGQKAPDGTDWTAEKIAKAIDDAGMSVLEHYLTYAGTGEGEVAAGSTYPVADDDQVLVPSGKTIVIDEDDSTIAYTGSAGDDKFYLKDERTALYAYNTLDGGEGNDTLILDKDLGGATIRNIENLVVNRGTGADYDMSLFATSFTLKGGSANLTNVTDQKLVVSGTPTHAITPESTLTVNMAAGQASVDLASQNRAASHKHTFELKGDSLTSVKLAVDEGAAAVDFKDSTDKVTDLAITATVSEAENDKAQVDATALTNLANVTVAGAGAVELTVTAAKDALKTVNAAGNTGGVTVDLSGADNAAFTGGTGADTLTVTGSKVAHTLGAGDDTLKYVNALGVGGSVAGGEGTDTISLLTGKLAALATDFKNGSITDFEALTVTDKLGANIDMANYAGINHLTVAGTSAAKVENMQSGSMLELTADATNNFDVSVKGATEGKADVLNIALTANTEVDGKVITVAGVETINVVATDTDLSDGVIEHTLGLKAAAATSVTVSGDAGLTLNLDASSTAIKSINASDNTGGLKVDVNTFSGVTVTGSSAADEITLGARTVATGGEGKDTFIVTATGMTKYATITDFGAGDKIQLKGAALTEKFGEAISLASTATFEDYVTEAVKGTSAATSNTVSWFKFTDGYTYVVLDTSNDTTFSNTDMVVRLQGVSDLEGVQVTGGAFSLPEGA